MVARLFEVQGVDGGFCEKKLEHLWASVMCFGAEGAEGKKWVSR